MKLASCFDPGMGKHGWCATCAPNAAKGTPGYCGEGSGKSSKETPIITANSTNWGFCTHECSAWNKEMKNMLMVTKKLFRCPKYQTSSFFEGNQIEYHPFQNL